MKGNKQSELEGNTEKLSNKDRWMKKQRKHHDNTYECEREKSVRLRHDDNLDDDDQ